jgi:hypothetical protein
MVGGAIVFTAVLAGVFAAVLGGGGAAEATTTKRRAKAKNRKRIVRL